MVSDKRIDRERDGAFTWGLPMTIGILLIIGGLFALYASVVTSLVSVLFLGVLLAATGVLQIIRAFRDRHAQPSGMYILTGVLAIIVGILFVTRPIASLVSLNFLFAAFLFASGLFHFITAIGERYRHWGWDLAYGIAMIAVAIYLTQHWRESSLWVLGTLVAIEILARGIATVAASWVIRDITHHPPGAYAGAA